MEPSKLSDVFCDNPYPGRGILLGLCPNGTHAALAYFIMGRSANSRNRALEKTGDDLAIRVLDEHRMVDPSLILYTPLRTLESETVVTNGDQTDTICDAIENGGSFYEALQTRRFEPDAPHFTPRISGMQTFGSAFFYKLSILKAGDEHGETCVRETFDYEPVKGAGHLIHTYQMDGLVLPSFSGEPRTVSIPDGFTAFAEGVWNRLNVENNVALYARCTNLKSGVYEDRIFNQYMAEGMKA